MNTPGFTYFNTLITQIGNIVETATPIVAGLALLFFFWGLATFILAAGNEEAKERGRRIMIWGVVALFVMVTVWGLTTFLGNIFGIRQSQISETPYVPGF